MSRKNIIIIACSVVVILLIVWLVSPNREDKANVQLDAAYKIEQSGQFDQAITLYAALIKEFEGTEAATLAVDYIVRVERYKERLLIQAVNKNLERIVLVLNGYREMMGEMPSSLAQLDGGEYMFDSNYIAEIVPDGYTYYLRFNKDLSFALYSIEDGADKVIKKTATNQASIISLAEFDQELMIDGYVKTEKGQMIFLEPAK